MPGDKRVEGVNAPLDKKIPGKPWTMRNGSAQRWRRLLHIDHYYVDDHTVGGSYLLFLGDKMEHNPHDETKLIAVIALLVSVLLVVSILFGITYLSDLRHIDQEVDAKSCYIKGGWSQSCIYRNPWFDDEIFLPYALVYLGLNVLAAIKPLIKVMANYSSTVGR